MTAPRIQATLSAATVCAGPPRSSRFGRSEIDLIVNLVLHHLQSAYVPTPALNNIDVLRLSRGSCGSFRIYVKMLA